HPNKWLSIFISEKTHLNKNIKDFFKKCCLVGKFIKKGGGRGWFGEKKLKMGVWKGVFLNFFLDIWGF
ncbi:hypothetical protein, partial [Staphylococcus aureus]|uniref:hypothetical protein n=1 Tax=Staphylococcus aureus TaxID=1280 RepID=UPI001CC25F46